MIRTSFFPIWNSEGCCWYTWHCWLHLRFQHISTVIFIFFHVFDCDDAQNVPHLELCFALSRCITLSDNNFHGDYNLHSDHNIFGDCYVNQPGWVCCSLFSDWHVESVTLQHTLHWQKWSLSYLQDEFIGTFCILLRYIDCKSFTTPRLSVSVCKNAVRIHWRTALKDSHVETFFAVSDDLDLVVFNMK